ncbi:hypothetical protein TH63_13370 [Rufibacter radiotolerans]|uniref:Uncharacterized protein n=1 Tax=Rufibacter radiotolerans TaxID=1379910 RepID=A0A0H4VKR0_9BACT|nr:hypothetical protein TH63_13370 [Rufibacter radiotolerans]
MPAKREESFLFANLRKSKREAGIGRKIEKEPQGFVNRASGAGLAGTFALGKVFSGQFWLSEKGE